MRWKEALKIKQNWTAEQARNDLERLIITSERPADKVVGMACEALDKQIPKKPLNPCGRWGGKSKGGNCPVCGSHTTANVSNFCRKCGQALDWSDTQ